MKNFHLIHVKYHGATNTRGSRVSLYSERFKERVTIPYDYALNGIDDMAEKYLLARGFEIVGQGEAMSGATIITNTFEPIKGEKGICKYCNESDRIRGEQVLKNGKCVYHNLMTKEV